MPTRKLTIWGGKADCHGQVNVNGRWREQYYGFYIESYEPLPESIKANHPEWKAYRNGIIIDVVQNRAAVFRQRVASRQDYRATDIVMGLGWEKDGEEPLESWSTDPQREDPPGPDAHCYVEEYKVREPTEVELHKRAIALRGPPTLESYQKMKEAEQRKLDEAEVLTLLKKTLTNNQSLAPKPPKTKKRKWPQLNSTQKLNALKAYDGWYKTVQERGVAQPQFKDCWGTCEAELTKWKVESYEHLERLVKSRRQSKVNTQKAKDRDQRKAKRIADPHTD